MKLNKTLALFGLILIWTPLVLPVIFGSAHLVQTGEFLFDFLMPGELFFMVFGGLVLLTISAKRSKKYFKDIFGFSIAAVSLFLILIALGQAEGGFKLIAVLSIMIAYDLLILVTGILGVMLYRSLK